MSNTTLSTAIVGEPEVVEDGADLAAHPAWHAIKAAATALQSLQVKDGSVPEEGDHAQARALVDTIGRNAVRFRDALPHDAAYLDALAVDLERWADGGFGIPDFLDSLQAFQPQAARVDGLRHLVIFPM
ncbi:MAG: hypothetical protein JWM51_222, partial [Microbacteriaceae bacterium]|nr:hypothetical protein [Microbacteriaceae bacterium]